MNTDLLNNDLMTLLFRGALLYFVFRWLLDDNVALPGSLPFKNLFLQDLKSYDKSITVTREENDSIEILVDKQPLRIFLGHIFRSSMSFPMIAGSAISDAITALLRCKANYSPTLPVDWQRQLMPFLYDGADDSIDIVTHQVAPDLFASFVINTTDTIRWLTRAEIDTTGLSTEELYLLAIKNLERSCNMLEMESITFVAENEDQEVADNENTESLVRFTTHDGFDATRVLIPSFFTRFSNRFGDSELLVGIPARDELVIMAFTDDAQANTLAERTQQEYERSPYPLYGGLLLVTENGISAWSPAV